MFCTKCGKKLEDDWKMCPNCGQNTETGTKPEESPPASREHHAGKEMEIKPALQKSPWKKESCWQEA